MTSLGPGCIAEKQRWLASSHGYFREDSQLRENAPHPHLPHTHPRAQVSWHLGHS